MKIQVNAINTKTEAMKKLNRLKVGKMYMKAEIGHHANEFDATWYRVLHKYCLYEEEYDMSLGKSAAISTLKWLMATKHLTEAYKTYKPYNYEMIEVIGLKEEIKEDNKVVDFDNILKKMEIELVEKWTENDKLRKSELSVIKEEIGYKRFLSEYGGTAYDLIYTSDEKIENKNKKLAKTKLNQLQKKVIDKVGEIKGYENLSMKAANLNAIIYGTKGKVKVETILAGGYNIQKLHFRTLVKKIKK